MNITEASMKRTSESENRNETSANVKRVFDNMAKTWENNQSEYMVRERIVQLAGIEEGSVVADIGCGKGVMLPHLLEMSPQMVYAIDISTEMLKSAKESFDVDNVRFINEDILDAALPQLDAALIFNAYPHLIDKAALAKRLSEVVRKNGFVVVAHSQSKERINGIHKTREVEEVSIPLRSAHLEIGEFLTYFRPDKVIDNDDLFFFKLIRE